MKKKFKQLKEARVKNKYGVIAYIATFAVVGGIVMLFVTRAATPVSVDNTLPNPTNVKAWGDDRVITVSWDEPTNASSRNIVGYYITWGTGGTFTNAKQSTHTITQIQPVNNGTTYNIKVQSVQGSYVQVPTPGAHIDGGTSAAEARANGKVSTGTTVSASPTSARVDQLRNKMTGFFDDFNTPAGAFDELKWNHATSGCAEIGQAGAFINNQFHAHNQIKSSCDRAQVVSRARGVFDITGRTEADPGVIVADFDGSAHGRDVWYIDLIPTNVRRNGAPLDITSHNSAFDDSAGDPKMIRMVQFADHAKFMYYDSNKNPREITPTFTCPSWGETIVNFAWCNIGENPVSGMSPIPEPSFDGQDQRQFPVENVRQHWTIHISNTKLKLFINSMLVWEGPMPADFVNEKKFTVQSNLFSYNTGKGDDENPTTALLHWDNFGFNGPASPVITHNYQDGGPLGTTPYLGFGTATNRLPGSPRTAKVDIPDPISSPTQARVMFTIGSTQWYYTWNSNDHIIVNGKRYNFPNPNTNQLTPNISEWYGPSHGDSTIPYADSIVINAADLKQGINDITFNLEQDGHNGTFMIFNVHVELDYTRGTQPAYTQPRDIFGSTGYMAANQPPMSSHDSYIFIEQNMGLPTGVIATTPGSTDTTPPNASINTPTNGASFTKGESINIGITATDNESVDKVVLYLDGSINTTITHSPFDHSLSTSGMSTGNHTVYVRVYDTAGLTNQSATVSFSLTDPTPEPPPTTIPGDLNNDGKVNVFDLSTLLSNWGRTGATKAQGDVDGNGTVNIFDMSTLLANWSR